MWGRSRRCQCVRCATLRDGVRRYIQSDGEGHCKPFKRIDQRRSPFRILVGEHLFKCCLNRFEVGRCRKSTRIRGVHEVSQLGCID